MKRVFLLSGENIELAKAEVFSLLGRKNAKQAGRLLFLETDNLGIISRLAFTNKAYSLLFSCPACDLKKNMAGVDWERFYKKDFCLRVHDSGHSEKELAGYVWRAVKKPKVNLVNPGTMIDVFFAGGIVFCCLLVSTIRHDFMKRKAHLRPGFAATSLSPKLARCLVNLTGIRKGALVDCFCGSGGILIEAGLMGLKPVGYDVDEAVLDKCRQNMVFYKIKSYELASRDALKIRKKIGYLATDLPYGRSSMIKGKNLYHDFLAMLKRNLDGKAVVVFPDSVDCRKAVNSSGLRIEGEFSYYIHKSLTKKIMVVSNG